MNAFVGLFFCWFGCYGGKGAGRIRELHIDTSIAAYCNLVFSDAFFLTILDFKKEMSWSSIKNYGH